MNIWLKEIEEDDGQEYLDCLNELACYSDVFAKPIPEIITMEEFDSYKRTRIKMFNGIKERPNVPKTNTYWIILDNKPIGFATLKHTADLNKPGGNYGCCLLKEYQNKGIGKIVSDLLSKIAYEELGIEEVIFTSKNENTQSQASIEKIGAKLVDIHDGYHYYILNLKEIFDKNKHI